MLATRPRNLQQKLEQPQKPEAAEAGPDDAVTAAVLDAIRGVRFGSVEVVIHDGRVVQILRTEKLRIER